LEASLKRFLGIALVIEDGNIVRKRNAKVRTFILS